MTVIRLLEPELETVSPEEYRGLIHEFPIEHPYEGPITVAIVKDGKIIRRESLWPGRFKLDPNDTLKVWFN